MAREARGKQSTKLNFSLLQKCGGENNNLSWRKRFRMMAFVKGLINVSGREAGKDGSY